MKKFIFALFFVLAAAGVFAGENIFYTLKYPPTYTIVSAFIVSSECPADGKCYSMVSVSYIIKDAIRNPDGDISMTLIKVAGYTPAQEPVIGFKKDTFVWNIVVDKFTTTQSY